MSYKGYVMERTADGKYIVKFDGSEENHPNLFDRKDLRLLVACLLEQMKGNGDYRPQSVEDASASAVPHSPGSASSDPSQSSISELITSSGMQDLDGTELTEVEKKPQPTALSNPDRWTTDSPVPRKGPTDFRFKWDEVTDIRRRLPAEPCTHSGGNVPILTIGILLGVFVIAIVTLFRNRLYSQTNHKPRDTGRSNCDCMYCDPDEVLSPLEVPGHLV